MSQAQKIAVLINNAGGKKTKKPRTFSSVPPGCVEQCGEDHPSIYLDLRRYGGASPDPYVPVRPFLFARTIRYLMAMPTSVSLKASVSIDEIMRHVALLHSIGSEVSPLS